MKVYSFVFLVLFGLGAKAQDALNVSLIMPFCSKQIAENPYHSNGELGTVSREYYQGMLIALDSLNTLGYKIKFNVFDTQNDSLLMLKLMAKPAFKESNLIIGPVLQGGNKMLTPFATAQKVYHVSPLMTFSKTKLTDDYWISSNPDLPSFAELIYNHIVEGKDSLNIVVVSDQSSLDKSFTPAFKKIVPASKKTKIRVVTFSPSLDINMYLSPTLNNVLIIPSAKEQLCNAVLYQVKDSLTIPHIRTIGFQQWLEFKNADIQLWQLRNVEFATTYFVDYKDNATKVFIQKYRERFFTDPSEAAIKGYDQGLYYIGNRYKLGNDFMKQLNDVPQKVLHTTYQFNKSKEGGAYQNHYLNFIRFEGDALGNYE